MLKARRSNSGANRWFWYAFKWQIYLSRLFGIVPVSFSSTQPDAVQVDFAWTVYAITLLLTFPTYATYHIRIHRSTFGEFSERVLSGRIVVTFVCSVVSRIICLSYRQKIQNVINALTPCNSVSQDATKKAIFLIALRFLLLSISLCLSSALFINILIAKESQGFELDYFIFKMTVIVTVSLVPGLFTTLVLILSRKLDVLAHGILNKSYLVWRDPFGQQYSAIWKHSKVLNNIFGFPILMYVLTAITSGSSILYFLITKDFRQGTDILLIWGVIWIALDFAALSIACTTTIKAADRIALAVSKALVSPRLRQADREELRDLSAQLLHMRIRFTAFDFFPLDNTTLYSAIAAITTYLVILLQARYSSSEDSEAALSAALIALNSSYSSFPCCSSFSKE